MSPQMITSRPSSSGSARSVAIHAKYSSSRSRGSSHVSSRPMLHAPAREQRQQLAEQLADERERSRVARDRASSPRGRGRTDRRSRRARARAPWYAVVLEPAVHVPETVLVGHELDVALAAERVERADLVGGERARVGVHLGVIAVRERVLAVELDLVDLPRREPVDESRRASSIVGTLSRETSSMTPRTGKIGMVADRADRQRAVVQARELRERGAAVEAARRRRRRRARRRRRRSSAS